MSGDDFGVLNLEDIATEDQRLSNENTNEGFLDQFLVIPDPKPGQTITFPVRILPPAKGAKLYQYTRLHQLNGRKIHCPRPLVAGKWDRTCPCVVCDYYNSLYRMKDQLEKSGRNDEAEKLEAEARSIKPIERYYYNAVARKIVDDKGEHTNVGPKILSVGKTVHKMIVRAIIGDESEAALGDVTHPKNGYDFIMKKEIRASGNDKFPNYDRSAFARESSPLGTPEEITKFVANLINLTQFRVTPEADALDYELAVHRGLIEDEKSNGFDVNKFDAKFKGNTKSVSVTAGPAATAAQTQVPDAAKIAVAEEIEITDQDFLKELQDMEKSA
jgi:hypothetical protein